MKNEILKRQHPSIFPDRKEHAIILPAITTHGLPVGIRHNWEPDSRRGGAEEWSLLRTQS